MQTLGLHAVSGNSLGPLLGTHQKTQGGCRIPQKQALSKCFTNVPFLLKYLSLDQIQPHNVVICLMTAEYCLI